MSVANPMGSEESKNHLLCLSYQELQCLCKRYNIPAKKTHSQLASSLALLLEVSIYVTFEIYIFLLQSLSCIVHLNSVWKEWIVFFNTGTSISCCLSYPVSNCERNIQMYVQKLLYVKLSWRIAYVCPMVYFPDSFALKDDAVWIIDSLINCRRPC